jgi:hypothetical protein
VAEEEARESVEGEAYGSMLQQNANSDTQRNTSLLGDESSSSSDQEEPPEPESDDELNPGLRKYVRATDGGGEGMKLKFEVRGEKGAGGKWEEGDGRKERGGVLKRSESVESAKSDGSRVSGAYDEDEAYISNPGMWL